MARTALTPEKQELWSRVEDAIEELRVNPDLTYSLAAEIFSVGEWQLKRRVIYRFGGLGGLRGDCASAAPRSDKVCMRCVRVRSIKDGFRMCDPCNEEIRIML